MNQCPLLHKKGQCLLGNVSWDNVGNVCFLLVCLCSNNRFVLVALVLNHSLQAVMKKIMCELFCYRK